MRLLVTGAAGMLGGAVAQAADRSGHEVIALTRRDLDVTDVHAVGDAVGAARARAIINCAAWTDVDGAEEHEAQATAVNASGAGHLARAAAATGARIVQVSTDYVFPGDAREPYVESDRVGPRSAYGRSKLAGEAQVAVAAPDHAIARTSWLFGAGGRNFVDTMLKLGAEREELRVVDDQIGCPTWTGHLAPALIELAQSDRTGVFHVAASGSCSWFELARTAIEQADLHCSVVPVATSEFPRPAPRPAYSVLASERGAPVLPPWTESLSSYLKAREGDPTEVTT